MGSSKKKALSFSAKSVAEIGIMAATIEGAKLALSFLPNIEVVTLLCALYGYVFGSVGIMAALVFVVAECFIWGINTWVISYFIYWPLVCAVFWLLRVKKIQNRFAVTAVAVALTAFFGVITSLVDVGLLTGYWQNFWQRFAIYYSRGAVFYIIHIVCNAFTSSLLFAPLKKLLLKVKNN